MSPLLSLKASTGVPEGLIPGRNTTASHFHLDVFLTYIEPVPVLQEVGQVEELWDELPQVGHVVLRGGLPGLLHAVEHAVGQVEVPALEINVEEDFVKV